MTDLSKKEFIVDMVIAVCKTCGVERKYPQNPPFRSAQEVIKYLKTCPITRCACGAVVCDLKLRLAEPN